MKKTVFFITSLCLILGLMQLIESCRQCKYAVCQQDREYVRRGGCLEQRIVDYVKDNNASIGVSVAVDGKIVASVNGDCRFPMLSVYKFPQALAVADYCFKNGFSANDSIEIDKSELRLNTWSPMRDKYGIRDLRLPVGELLEYSAGHSDNNACDILFRLIGGTTVADSLIKTMGFVNISIKNTENEMHIDTDLCYDNYATPNDMSLFLDRFFNSGMCIDSAFHSKIADIMINCKTGNDRIKAPLENTGASVWHKTGTGDRNVKGLLIGVNDAGYVVLPDGKRYSIAVFVADTPDDIAAASATIAEISKIVYTAMCEIK